jgi:hypothetical protein
MNPEGVPTRRGTGRWQQGAIGNLLGQAEESRMSASTCLAYREDGTLGRAPASFFDWQRGGLVCRDHVPLEIRVAQSQAEAYGSAHMDLEHRGQRDTWRLRWDDEIGRRDLRRLEEPTC